MEGYAALFGASFLAATFVPFSSEALLVALLIAGADAWSAWAVASVGNTLGGLLNWFLGRHLRRYRERRWFPVDAPRLERAARGFRRYGAWSLLFSWLPVVGDPLTLAAGVLGYGLLPFLALVFLGKAARYGLLVAGVAAAS